MEHLQSHHQIENLNINTQPNTPREIEEPVGYSLQARSQASTPIPHEFVDDEASTKTDQLGLIDQIEVPEDIVPATTRKPSERCFDHGEYTSALKTFAHPAREGFKHEADVLRLMSISPTQHCDPTLFRLVKATPRSSNLGDDRGRKRLISTTEDDQEDERKRKRSDKQGGGRDDAGNDQKYDDRDGLRAKGGKKSEEILRLACPFAKHDPTKYRDRRTCLGPGFSGVHRVKEHVFRKHSRPRHFCPRCQSVFKDVADLDDHLHLAKPCDIVAVKATEEEGYISEEQERALKSRKCFKTAMTEDDRWRRMYSIIFPYAATTPSPYHDDVSANEKGRMVDVEKFSEYLRRELPIRIRQELDAEVNRKFSNVEAVPKDRITDMIQNIFTRNIFDSWKDFSERTASIPMPWTEMPSANELASDSSLDGLSSTDTISSPWANICTEKEASIPLDFDYIIPGIQSDDWVGLVDDSVLGFNTWA